jgi:sulfatase modifying factor 1
MEVSPRTWRISFWVATTATALACSRQPPAPEAARPSHEARGDVPAPAPHATATPLAAPPDEEPAAPVPDAAPPDDPMAGHAMTQPDLLRLITLAPPPDDRAAARRDSLLAYLIAPTPGHFNQGNKAIAHHAISRARCLDGLKDVVVQTDEQRAICKGEPYMVPVYANGDPQSAKVCIDQFEFPNRPCELPFVWGSPSEAETMCRVEGKRLCTQQEWSLSCTADPEGKQKWSYAYGDKLDLTVCHTNEPHETGPDGKAWKCWVRDATTTWNTCSTDTEPSGSFPRCRSRLGVYDQHGNVAEMMTRAEDSEIYTQLKGSAFFYVDVAREPGKAALHPERESYPDTCAYDPRWHVEKLKESLHCNYHLGFRCCKQL